MKSYSERIREILEFYPDGLTHYAICRILELESNGMSRVENVEDSIQEVAVLKRPDKQRDNRFVLPKYKEEAEIPSEILITWFDNDSITIKTAEDKKRIVREEPQHRSHRKFKVKVGTFRNMIEDGYQRGHYVLASDFYPARDSKDKKYKIRIHENLLGQRLIWLDIDEVPESIESLEDLSKIPFIKRNALAVAESSSGNYRIFFLLPDSIKFESSFQNSFLENCVLALAKACGLKADIAGSRPTNGFYGRVGVPVVYLDNWLSLEELNPFFEAILAEKKRKKAVARKNRDADAYSLSNLDQRYLDYDWKLFPCPSTEHENDSWESEGRNATQVNEHEKCVVLYCHKCSKSHVYWNDESIKARTTKSRNQYNPMSEEEKRVFLHVNTLSPIPEELSASEPVPHRHFKHFSEHAKSLLKDDIKNGFLKDRGWDTTFPIDDIKLNERDEKYKVWNLQERNCSQCGSNKSRYFIDNFHWISGYHCGDCHQTSHLNSYLEMELEKQPGTFIKSQHQGYLTDDKFLQDLEVFEAGKLTFLNAMMGTGKTHFAFDQIKKNPDYYYFYLVPRTSLAVSLHTEKTDYTNPHGFDEKSFGLFYGGSPASDRYFGTKGVISTVNSLKHLLEKFYEDYTDKETPDCFEFSGLGIQKKSVRIVIDEVDFSVGLFYSYISKNLTLEIRDLLRGAIADTGLLVLGQTEFPSDAENLARDLLQKDDEDLKPFLTIYTNKVESRNAKAKLNYYHNHSLDRDYDENFNTIQIGDKSEPKVSVKYCIVYEIIRKIETALKDGKNVYCFLDSARWTRSIGHYINEFLGFKCATIHANSKGEKNNHKFMLGVPLEKMDLRAVVTSKTIDVGISINDENAYVIVGVLENPANLGNSSFISAVQQSLRVRSIVDVDINYTVDYRSLPITKSVFEDWRFNETSDLLESDEFSTQKNIVNRDFLLALISDQPQVYMKSHFEKVGFQVIEKNVDMDIYHLLNGKSGDIQSLVDILKEREHDYKEGIKASSLENLSRENVLPANYIREMSNNGVIGEELCESYNMILEAVESTGFKFHLFYGDPDSKIEEQMEEQQLSITDEQLKLAYNYISQNLNRRDSSRKRLGFRGVHLLDSIIKEREEDGESGQYLSSHIRANEKRSEFLKRLIPALPIGLRLSETKLLEAVMPIFSEEDVTGETVASLIKNGFLGTTIATKGYNLPLESDLKRLKSNEREMIASFIKFLVEAYYPAILKKVNLKDKPEKYYIFKTNEKNYHYLKNSQLYLEQRGFDEKRDYDDITEELVRKYYEEQADKEKELKENEQKAEIHRKTLKARNEAVEKSREIVQQLIDQKVPKNEIVSQAKNQLESHMLQYLNEINFISNFIRTHCSDLIESDLGPVYRILQESNDWKTIKEIAQEVDLSENAIRRRLNQLIEDGSIKAKGKRNVKYRIKK